MKKKICLAFIVFLFALFAWQYNSCLRTDNGEFITFRQLPYELQNKLFMANYRFRTEKTDSISEVSDYWGNYYLISDEEYELKFYNIGPFETHKALIRGRDHKYKYFQRYIPGTFIIYRNELYLSTSWKCNRAPSDTDTFIHYKITN